MKAMSARARAAALGPARQRAAPHALSGTVVDSCMPGAPGTEICVNGLDDDCDSSTDEDCGIWYRDFDGDTYGNPAVTSQAVSQPAGYVANNTDCNDSDPAINPAASDANCDGIDNNCSGAADEGYVSQSTSCGIGACAATRQHLMRWRFSGRQLHAGRTDK